MAKLAAVVVAAAAVVAVSGCTLDATLVVHSSTSVDVRATATATIYPDAPTIDQYCAPFAPGMKVTRAELNGDQATCAIEGTTTFDTLNAVGLGRFAEAGEYLSMRVGDPSGDLGASWFGEGLTAVDVTITFPGAVTEHVGGEVSGSTIRWTDAAEFSRNRGLEAQALNHPGVSNVVLAGGLGVLVGVGAGAAGMAWWLRRSGSDAAPGAPAAPTGNPARGTDGPPGIADPAAPAPDGPTPTSAGAAPTPPARTAAAEDPEVWAP